MPSRLLSFFKSAAPATRDASAQAQLERARELHQQGQLDAVIAMCDEILAAAPDNAEAHYRRANVLRDRGNLQAAVAGYDQAIVLRPDYAHAFCNRAVVLAQLGKVAEALASYDRAIALDPKDALSAYNRGMLLNATGQKDAALASFDQAIAGNPDYFPAHFGRAVLLQAGKRLQAALQSYDRALSLNAGDAAVHYNRGTVLRQLERWAESLASYDRAIALNGQFAPAHASRAEVLQRLGRSAEALESYDRAIEIDPKNAVTCSDRGVVLQTMMRFDEALASYDQAIAVDPNYSPAHFNRGSVLKSKRDLAGALSSYDRAISMQPGYVDAYVNRASVLEALGSVDAAIANLEKAIALQPDLAEAHFNLALMLLKVGDLLAGWASYEWRWRAESGPIFREKREFKQPLWLGDQPIAGKTILLYAEQGLGDTLLFIRYCEMVTALGARVILEVHRPLVSLCTTLRGVARVVAFGEPLPDFDVQCPLLSLPLVFKTTLETIPSTVGYVSSDPAKVAVWQERLGPRTKPRIGLTWSGNQTAGTNRERHFPLTLLVPHLSEDFEFFCLQTDITAADQQTLQENPIVRQLQGELRDFTDTAALCACMDEIISVDTSVAHLSGALGQKTCVLLAFDADWRWLTERDDSPWYPTVRLFRQKSHGEWRPVLERVFQELHREFGR